MKKVIYPKPEFEKLNVDEKCPDCKGDMRHDMIPCPDGREECAVCHYGYRCLECGEIFQ